MAIKDDLWVQSRMTESQDLGLHVCFSLEDPVFSDVYRKVAIRCLSRNNPSLCILPGVLAQGRGLKIDLSSTSCLADG